MFTAFFPTIQGFVRFSTCQYRHWYMSRVVCNWSPSTHLKSCCYHNDKNFFCWQTSQAIVKIDSTIWSSCLRHYVQNGLSYIQNGLSYSGRETWPTLCINDANPRSGVKDLKQNKHQLLHRITIVKTPLIYNTPIPWLKLLDVIACISVCILSLGPCIPNFFPKFESSFESERVFRESRRVRKARTLPFRLVPTLIFANFCKFLRKLGSDITEIFPKFKKSPFPKLAKTKISEKNV
jgi:hypothetical protein